MLPSTRDPHPGVFQTGASERQLDRTVVLEREAGGHPFDADTSVEVSPTLGVGKAGTDGGTRLRKRRKATRCSGGRRR
jgi:hypothetical protein